jgi:putative membrane protein
VVGWETSTQLKGASPVSGPWSHDDVRNVGDEPDYRFTLANERTFLAYVRTALAFFAAGTAILSFFDRVIGHRVVVVVIGTGLYALGLFTAASCYWRWRRLEEAMRLKQPLPFSLVPPIITGSLIVLAIVAFVGALVQ